MNELLNEILNIEAKRIHRGHPQAIEMESSPLSKQVGGNHYKGMAIQPMEFSMANNLNACQHTAVKYIVRKKGIGDGPLTPTGIAARIQDIEKAIHTLEIYKQMIAEGQAT